jgi:hypothetical protein
MIKVIPLSFIDENKEENKLERDKFYRWFYN